MKTFVRALEDIAEVEQEKLFDQERAAEQKILEDREKLELEAIAKAEESKDENNEGEEADDK